MTIWQADFYKRPSPDRSEQVWELSICDANRSFEYAANCPQSQANSTWIATQLQLVDRPLPDTIQVFRPQSLSLITAAGRSLGVDVEPTRRTTALKEWLQEKQFPTSLEKSPPVPLPENLWGNEWRFATLQAGELTDIFTQRPIPILYLPEYLKPINLGVASTVPIPGVVIYGGKQSMRLARWLQQSVPIALNYISGAPDGLVLEAGLVDRWVMVTFDDVEVSTAAKVYDSRKQLSRGLHFLLVQPDDSGMTYTGFWLLQTDNQP